MTEPELHRKSMDELPLSQLGWDWLAELGRADNADKVLRPEFETNGGQVSAWRGDDLSCYFVLIRDTYNWCDLHCQLVTGRGAHSDLQVSQHDDSDKAVAIGHQWLVAHLSDAPFSQKEVNQSLDGACIVSVWESSRRLRAYFTVIPSPQGRYILVCKLLSRQRLKSEGSF